MKQPSYDVIDLVLLTAAYADNKGPAISIDGASRLIDAARVLHEVWLELQDAWDCVWAYEVAEPIGAWLALNPHATRDDIKDEARTIARAAMRAMEHEA